MRLVNQAKTEEQKYIENMNVLEVVERKEASGSKVIRTRWVVTNKRTQGKPSSERRNVRARWVAQEHKCMDGPDCERYAPTLRLEPVKGVLSHAAAAGRNKDHVVAVFDVRRAFFCAEPLPKTFVELPDYHDFDTRTRCCERLRRCLCGPRQVARSWQREREKRNQSGWDGDGTDVHSSLHAGNGWESSTATTSCSQDRDHLLMQHGSRHGSAMRHENK